MAKPPQPIPTPLKGPLSGLQALTLGWVEAWVFAPLYGESTRLFLWLPVLMAAGVGAYFALPVEPPFYLVGLGLALVLLLVWLSRARPMARVFSLGLVAVVLGFGAGQLRTASMAAPVLSKEFRFVTLTAKVLERETLTSGYRLVLAPEKSHGLPPLEKVRLTVRTKGEKPLPGDLIRLKATLRPPPEPVFPGGYDFQRSAFFQQIGAVGYAVSAVTILQAGQGPYWGQALRSRISARIQAALPGPAGSLATALITGDRHGIPKDHEAALRDAGLAHLLAISGLHVGMVTAILFFTSRFLLALIEPLALRYPIKKIAAVLAGMGALGYLMLSGGTVPTQRAFLMTCLILVAVLFDRQAVSLRLVALAAMVLLLLSPESLLGASFQMSFAAVVALVAAYEQLSGGLQRWMAEGPLWHRPVGYGAGVALTSLVAGLATAPVALYHFGRFVTYGLLANLVAVPVMAFWVMPWGLVSLVLMPLGLESWALLPMGWGIDLIMTVAQTVAAWPAAVQQVPALPFAGLLLFALGGLWLCLWQRPWRLLGVPVLCTGVVLTLVVQPPDIYMDPEGRIRALHDGRYTLWVSSLRKGRFAQEVWSQHSGARATMLWPDQGLAMAGKLRCDPLGCIYRDKGQTVSLPRQKRALDQDCRSNHVIIAPFAVSGRCPSAGHIVDYYALKQAGAHAVHLETTGVRVVSNREVRGRRPWTHYPQ